MWKGEEGLAILTGCLVMDLLNCAKFPMFKDIPLPVSFATPFNN